MSQLAAHATPKTRVMILGSGWAGNRLARTLSKELYDVTLVSPANHFLVTPLLPQCAVGTLEARNVQENVRTIDGLHKYYQAKARTLDLQSQVVECEECITNERPNGHRFRVGFDVLVVATGCKTDTFGTPGVVEAEGREVHFLKHIAHAQGIRNRMLECFERAAMPGVDPAERDRLLSFVVVGGGPTSCEFTAELHDFLATDVSKWAYPDLAQHVRLTLVEAGPRLMPAFDAALVEHMMLQLATRDVDVRIGTRVKALKADGDGCTNMAVLQAEGEPEEVLRFGTLVWSAGLQQVKFVQSLNLRGIELLKGRTGRLSTDEYAYASPNRTTPYSTVQLSVAGPAHQLSSHASRAWQVHACALQRGGRRDPAGGSGRRHLGGARAVAVRSAAQARARRSGVRARRLRRDPDAAAASDCTGGRAAGRLPGPLPEPGPIRGPCGERGAASAAAGATVELPARAVGFLQQERRLSVHQPRLDE